MTAKTKLGSYSSFHKNNQSTPCDLLSFNSMRSSCAIPYISSVKGIKNQKSALIKAFPKEKKEVKKVKLNTKRATKRSDAMNILEQANLIKKNQNERRLFSFFDEFKGLFGCF